MGVIGTAQPRVEDHRFLTGSASFTDDLPVRLEPLATAAHVVYIGSPVAHGRLRAVAVQAALARAGVAAVITAADVPPELGDFPLDVAGLGPGMARSWLADGVVRYVGEPVAAVVADTLEAALDAAEHVVVEVDPLPTIVDPVAALAEGAPLLFPETGSNVCFRMPRRHPVDFATCEVVVGATLINQRVNAAPLEPRAGAACWLDARVTLWATTQGVWPVKRALAAAYRLAADDVRVVSPDVGGGFGSKEALYPELLLLPLLARLVGRPVRWSEARSYSMLHLGHGRAQVQHVTLGGSRDGALTHYRLHVVQDCGAYPRLGAVLPGLSRATLTGPYRIPLSEFEATSVLTNTAPVLAYRGAGQPEACSALEWAIDAFASAAGLDPAELRRRNLLGASEHPWTTSQGFTYDHGQPDVAFEQVLERGGYEALRVEQATRRAEGDRRQLGLGVVGYIEVTGAADDAEYAAVEILAGGRARVAAGSFNHGQGHATMYAMIVADRLGVALDDVELVDNDTDRLARGGNTGGSRSMQTAGNATWLAAEQVAEQGRLLAAELFEANVDDVVLDRELGRFHVAGTPARHRGWADIAAMAASRGVVVGAEADFGTPARTTFSGGAQLAVVEVDTETGGVTLQRLVAVGDAGRILNPLLAEGQLHGGLAQGAAQALTEAVVYDPNGNPLTTTFLDYGIISAAELPDFDASFVDLVDPLGGLGAKGLGESGAIGATAAVRNAVVDALRPFGVHDVALPCSGEAVWRALRAASTG